MRRRIGRWRFRRRCRCCIGRRGRGGRGEKRGFGGQGGGWRGEVVGTIVQENKLGISRAKIAQRHMRCGMLIYANSPIDHRCERGGRESEGPARIFHQGLKMSKETTQEFDALLDYLKRSRGFDFTA